MPRDARGHPRTLDLHCRTRGNVSLYDRDAAPSARRTGTDAGGATTGGAPGADEAMLTTP
jgi:hypothetical protein